MFLRQPQLALQDVLAAVGSAAPSMTDHLRRFPDMLRFVEIAQRLPLATSLVLRPPGILHWPEWLAYDINLLFGGEAD